MCVGLMENEVDALVNSLIPAAMRWTSRDTRAFLEKTNECHDTRRWNRICPQGVCARTSDRLTRLTSLTSLTNKRRNGRERGEKTGWRAENKAVSRAVSLGSECSPRKDLAAAREHK